MEKLSHQELVHRQNAQPLPRIAVTAVLNNIRSLYNVGSLFRTADGAGLEKIWLCGVTGIPPSSKISKTALGAENKIAWEYSRSAVECVKRLKNAGYQIVLAEQTQQSIPYYEYKPRGPAALVMGNEISGIEEEILPLCHTAVEIEMAGLKNSLNVAVAFGILAYHLRREILKGGADPR